MSQRSPDGPDTDIEALLERDAGVPDIDSQALEDMCRAISRIVRRECDTAVREIHVVGSFARGEAMKRASDIDLRVVCVDPLPGDVCTRFEHQLRVEHGPRILPEICGYLDARLSTEPPADEVPSVLVWQRAL